MPDLNPAFSTPDLEPHNQPVTRTGTCSVCGREGVELLAGMLTGHTEQRVDRTGIHDTDQPCDGSGQPPEEGSETRPTQTRTHRRRGVGYKGRSQSITRDSDR